MAEKDKSSMLKSVQTGHSIFENAQKRQTSTDRRPFLRGLVASVGIVLGFGSSASASERRGEKRRIDDVVEGYRTPSDVQQVLQNKAGELLETLTENGYLPSAEIQITGVKPHQAPTKTDPLEGTYVTGFKKDGELTAHISIIRKTPSVVVRLNFQPQVGNVFATIKSRDGELISVVNPGTDGDVSTQKFCTTDYTCPPSSCCTLCDKQQKHEETCCTYSDGSTSCTEEPIDECCDPSVCC